VDGTSPVVSIFAMEKRRARGAQRLQQRLRAAQQGLPPVAFGAGRLDQPLLQALHHQRDLHVRVVLDGRDARGGPRPAVRTTWRKARLR
jgi:hypothetical protein